MENEIDWHVVLSDPAFWAGYFYLHIDGDDEVDEDPFEVIETVFGCSNTQMSTVGDRVYGPDPWESDDYSTALDAAMAREEPNFELVRRFFRQIGC